ncbi:MAG TPA: alginate lyase family protein [Tepidisphaeraceae bacterium]|nr:alginate lyase family protein [Tepidisphaeraceae bacterium]
MPTLPAVTRHRSALHRCVQLQPLERRVFLAATPAPAAPPAEAQARSATIAPAAITTQAVAPSDVLTRAARQDLLDHWNGPNRADLQAKLNANKLGAFDGALLAYMRSRAGNTFFWNTADVPKIKEFINTKLATASVISNADHVVAHRFPNGNSENYNVQLPAGDIDWSTSNSNPEFVHTQNRHEFWLDLSQAHVLTGNSKYVNEMIAQLSSWSEQSPAPRDPDAWGNKAPWHTLDVAVRAQSWTWAYPMVLSSSNWTAAANTLLLYKLWQHGDNLQRATPSNPARNHALFEAQGLLQLAHLVPEFAESAGWRAYGRNLLFAAMDAQLNPDGGHAESSPGYAGNVILALLEMYWLDQKKGEQAAWSPQRIATIENAAKAHVQFLSPDGKLTPLSDTYRSTVGPFWDRPRVILNNTRDFPAAKPRMRDVWLFGPTTAGKMVTAPVNPAVPARADTYSLPQSGYYMMRSGPDANARQITFDAGPTGGGHGHYDLLNFELFGYGRPLIADPGLYTYDTSERRTWAISTVAHNTINIDRLNHQAVEGVDSEDLWSSGLSQVAGGHQITAHHGGYKFLDNAQVWRSVWYDGDGVMVVADLGAADAEHGFATSFLLPGTNTSRDLGAGWIRSNNATGGNVKIQALLQPGQSAHRQNQIGGGSTNVFTSSDPDAHIADDATRFYIDQAGTFVGFVTLITTYAAGASVPNITAQLVGAPTDGAFEVQIFRNGKAAERVPFFSRPGRDFRPAAPVAGANDVAFDSAGRLHLVYNDREEKNLKYSVRDTKGRWSLVQTIDPGFEAGGWPSLALDASGNPAVAYFDGDGGDLKFARQVGSSWHIEKVDTQGSVGLYPSLVYGRDGGTAIIGYYHRTKGDLRLAAQKGDGWSITTIDADGDVGRCTSMTLNPNDPDGSSVAIAYDDSATGAKKFASQLAGRWSIATVDNTTPTGGGYTSLAYTPDGSPTISYYDSSNSALKFARLSAGGGTRWSTSTVASTGAQGLYTSHFYDAAGRANILFFKKTNITAHRAVLGDAGWTLTPMGTGGREIQTARTPDGTVAWTNLDADGLRVQVFGA